MEEEWRDIEGYEGLYQVSNLGRVKSINYKRTGKERILKAVKDNWGYLTVRLYKDNKGKQCRVHRLVAQAFIPNQENLPQVNHISEDKTDNRVQNLEWITNKDNCNHGTRNQRMAESLTNNPKKSKPVIGISKESGLILEYPSISEASRHTGTHNSHICECCNGKLKSAGGYYWMYAE